MSVKGRVVVVRYGGIFRGTKVLLAQQRGAVGVLIYSDPADDGYPTSRFCPLLLIIYWFAFYFCNFVSSYLFI